MAISINFNCEHCEAPLQHNENQVLGYAIAYIVIVSIILLSIGINAFITMAISVVSYALIRHKFIEPFIEIECNQSIPNGSRTFHTKKG
ncbi:hypothetical protein CTN03_00960 [Photobacterium angustum]|nr:hypothetical protein CTN03_00960 [Photobacterium angustum]